MIPVTTLRPFTRMLMTIGQIPTSYLISMTYEEQLIWFCNYLEKTVIPAIDNNAEAVEEVQEVVTELHDYIDNYFDNLDVQEEINNKLDAMAEGGQLTDIIAQYLGLAGVLAYDTISDMSEAINIADGSICKTLGKESYNDGLGAFYKVRTITNDDTIDGFNIVALDVSNTLIAEKTSQEILYLKVKTTDSFATIQKYFNIDNPKLIEFETGTYTFTDTFRLNKDTKINLNNSELIFNIPTVAEDYTASHGFFNFKTNDEFLEYGGNGNIEVFNGKITHGNFSFCHASNIKFYNIDFELCNNDHVLEMMAINGLVVENCIFNGQSTSASNYKEMIQIDTATHGAFPWFGSDNPTYDNTPNKNWLITNNVFSNPNTTGYTFDAGIGSHDFTNNVFHENIIISNNKFLEMTNLGIQLINTKNAIINNNTFTKTSYTDGVTGCMVRFRNSNEYVTIKENIFEGNVRAIESASDYVLFKDINILNNTFRNYKYTDSNLGAINITNPINVNINGNYFENFTQNMIRTNANNVTTPSDYTYIINNNEFNSIDDIANNIIKLYCGVATVNNNVFKSNNNNYSTFCIITTNDGNFANLYAVGNVFSPNLVSLNRCLSDECVATQYNDVKNIYKSSWWGSSTSLTNESFSLPYSHFNRMNVVLGDGAHSQIHQLTTWEIHNKLDARTFTIIGIDVSNETMGVCKLTLNVDGTFNYTGNAALRNVFFYNE